ncbi:hypothetical protein CVU37_11785 [candidate division BRC1 bacterium HGW-BRC1-1]|nr:MAG: hypothetical protein CVU37_11785 [candidate division BRC1 bacterium HGW-BRC1-1]
MEASAKKTTIWTRFDNRHSPLLLKIDDSSPGAVLFRMNTFNPSTLSKNPLTLTTAIFLSCATLLPIPAFAAGVEGGYGKTPNATEGTVSSWPTGKKLIALTYDDGPNTKVTQPLMDLLESEGVPATFYLLGQTAKANPKLTAEIQRRGFEVGNHSWSHPQLTKLGVDGIKSQLQRANDAMTAPRPVTTMRPPYGAHNATVRRVCSDMGFSVILWDVDTNDWRKGTTAEKIVKTVLEEAKDGSIILMHDRLPTTVPATRQIIAELKKRGYTFVTVSQLLAQPRLSAKKP